LASAFPIRPLFREILSLAPITIATLLFLVAVVLILLDIVIPSGAMLLVAGIAAGLGSVLFGFRDSFSTGLTFLILFLAAIPILFMAFLHLWPKTGLGKKILGEIPKAESYQWSDATRIRDAKQLIGVNGIAESELLPSGTVRIEGHSFEALSDGPPIHRGDTIRVVRIDMGRLVVVPGSLHHGTTLPPVEPSNPLTGDSLGTTPPRPHEPQPESAPPPTAEPKPSRPIAPTTPSQPSTPPRARPGASIFDLPSEELGLNPESSSEADQTAPPKHQDGT
jgi:membrane protein implicated in regulation of membrane protease activity